MSPAAARTGRMHGALVIARREVAAYFDAKIAYVFAIAFVLLANSIFMNEFFLSGVVDMTGLFDLMPLLLPFFVPAITMRLWAEEKKSRTIELLLTLPVRPGAAVLGKFLAALFLFLLLVAGTLPIPAMLLALGSPDIGQIVGGYVGLVLLGSLFLSLGMFLSALTSDQITAFVTTTVVAFLFVLSGDDRVVAVLDGLFPRLQPGTLLYESFSVRPRYEEFVRGIVSASGLAYFGGLSIVFLWLNAHVLERHRE